ncbi:MAG: long-chain fatty acid--CoA ligase [Pseudomonadota bacterium]
METVNEILEASSRKYPTKTAIIFEDRRITYEEVEKSANQCAHGLMTLGIKRGDMVGILIPNCPEFIVAYFGILKSGATVVPMNPTLSGDELAYMMKDATVKAVFTLPPLLPLLQKLSPQVKHLTHLIIRGDETSDEAISFSSLVQGKESTPPGIRVGSDETAVCIYTSGTTGSPKGALLTHRNLLANVNSVLQVFPVDASDVFTCILPLFHAYSAMASLLCPFALGAGAVVTERFIPRKCLQMIQDHRITVFVGVPALFAVLTQIKNPREFDLTSWRFCVSGGAPLWSEILTLFETMYPVKIYEGDGPTECSPVTSVNPIGGKRKVGSIGLPLPDVGMKIVDEHDNELPPEHVGEIVVRGPNVMKGYLNQPEATKESLRNGWFHTGDIGKMDHEGYFYILDRKKDMLIVGGLNVYSQEVEKVLLSHPQVAEAAVVGRPDKLRGEVPRAYVVLREEEKVDPDDLIRHCREHLAPYKVPRDITVVQGFPKTATGKVMKWKLSYKGVRSTLLTI